MWPRVTHAHERRSRERCLVPIPVCNGVVCKRPGWNENLRILREMADCKQSSLTDEDTCFGVALDKGTNRQGRSLLIYLFLVTIVKKERLISCCFF